MDGSADIPLTPSYACDPSAAASANPRPESFGFASVSAPPTTGLAGGLFMAPQTTSAGGVAPPPAVKPRAPLSTLPNAAVAKAGKVFGKKNKAADDSSRRPEKKLARRATDAVATEAPFNDETYISTMGVDNSHWSQANEVHLDDHEYEVDEDDEGILDAPKGRAGNYTMDEDILLCNTWLKVSRDAIVRGDQSRDAYWIRMKEYCDLHNKSGIDRADRSLRTRWSTISKDRHGGMSYGSLMGGTGAPPGDMGGRMSFGVSHIPSHDAVVDLSNTFRAPHNVAVCHNEDEEEETSSDEEEESEEEEDNVRMRHDC
ncbi:putative receptor protein kinase ZmPK1 [Hordeum vulgare]|nr:putative receptor protein kinase ZmPK1 [Hordeum vulgare]